MARNTAVQVAGDVGSKFASLAFYVVMARELGKSGLGDFTFALSLSLVFLVIAGFGTDSIVTREIARRPESVHRLFWTALLSKLALGVPAILLANAVAWLGPYADDVRASVAILSLAVLFELLAKTLHATFRGFEDMAPIAASFLWQRWVTAIAGIGAILLGAGLVTISLIYLGGSLLALAYLARRLVSKLGRPRVDLHRGTAKWLVLTSVPIGLNTMFGALIARIDTTLISFLQDNVAVGVYSAAYRVFEGTFFMTWAFGWAALPALSRLSRSSEPTVGRAYELGCKVALLTLLPLGVVFALFAEPIVDLIYGEDFSEAVDVLRLLGPATALYGVATISTTLLVAQERQRALVWIVASAAIGNVALNLVAIPEWSYDGSAAVMSLTQIVLTGLLVSVALRLTGRISAARVLAAPLLGALAMVAAAALLGTGYAGLVAGGLAYLVVAVLVERLAFPDDFRAVRGSLAGGGNPTSAPEAG